MKIAGTKMTIKQNHVNDDKLHLLLVGDEFSDAFRQAASHVERCENCRSRLDDLSGADDIDIAARELLLDYPWTSLSSVNHSSDADQVSENEDTASVRQGNLDFLLPPTHPELLGRIGRYDIEKVIGQGGMGVVMKAHDGELNRPVAVKALAKHLSYSGAARQRFARESRAAAAVVHEHVVAIHNVDSESDTPFIVMQYVAGESLQSRVDRDGPLHTKELLRIGMQVATGLAAAHEQGVIHRDIKPANILLERGVERALITDFGLARTVDDAALTQTGVIAGTPHYMSPEQAGGHRVDQRTDLFSLGSLIYLMATANPPFRAESAMGVMNRICHDRQQPLWQRSNDIPDELSVLVDRLMSKQAAKRFSSATAVREQLAGMLAELQQPRPRLGRTLRRLAMHYPKRLAAFGFLSFVAVAVCCTIVVSPSAEPRSDRQLSDHQLSEPKRPAGLPDVASAESISESNIEPVLDSWSASEYRVTIDDLDKRLSAIQRFEDFTVPPVIDNDPSENLQSVRSRLDRLQDYDSHESLLNPFEEQ